MKVRKNNRGSYDYWEVVNLRTGRVVYSSYNRIDCEQYIWVMTTQKGVY